jgi:hypothetical protein
MQDLVQTQVLTEASTDEKILQGKHIYANYLQQAA